MIWSFCDVINVYEQPHPIVVDDFDLVAFSSEFEDGIYNSWMNDVIGLVLSFKVYG